MGGGRADYCRIRVGAKMSIPKMSIPKMSTI